MEPWQAIKKKKNPVATLRERKQIIMCSTTYIFTHNCGFLKDGNSTLKRKVCYPPPNSCHVICQVSEFLDLVHKVHPSVAFSLWWAHNIKINCSQYLQSSVNHINTIDKQHSGLRVTGTLVASVDLAYPGQHNWSGRTVFFHQNRDQMAAHQVCAACFHSRWLWKHPWCRNKSQTHSCPCDRCRQKTLLFISSLSVV